MNAPDCSVSHHIVPCEKSAHAMQLSSKFVVVVVVPRDAMLARYMLSSCVRPSVRHKSEFYEYGLTSDHADNAMR